MNQRQTIDIRQNPRGDVYRGLLSAGAGACSTALLVVRRSMQINPSVDDFLGAAAPYLIERKELSEWPGTQLFEHTAPVYRFRLEPGFLALATTRATSLFDWIEPSLPEDLCLLRADGSPWLVTISHERDAYLEIEAAELTTLLRDVPGLQGCLAKPSSDPDERTP